MKKKQEKILRGPGVIAVFVFILLTAICVGLFSNNHYVYGIAVFAILATVMLWWDYRAYPKYAKDFTRWYKLKVFTKNLRSKFFHRQIQ